MSLRGKFGSVNPRSPAFEKTASIRPQFFCLPDFSEQLFLQRNPPPEQQKASA